jgi:hypothetical protein
MRRLIRSAVTAASLARAALSHKKQHEAQTILDTLTKVSTLQDKKKAPSV